MSRGKRMSVADKIAKINEQMQILEKRKADTIAKLKVLKKKLKTLEKEQSIETMAYIQQSIKDSNINPNDVIEFIKNKAETSEQSE